MSLLTPANPFTWAVTVAAADVDALGHASNVSVVRWMNDTAWEHSKALGWDVERYRRAGGWFVVRRHEIDYHRPSLLGDALRCMTWLSGMAKVTAERRHRIVRTADGAVIAEGVNLWAYVDARTGRPLRIPAELRAAFDLAVA